MQLNKMYSNIPDTCFKCNIAKGTLIHCMWECDKIKEFWKEISNMIEHMVSISLPLDPGIFILGIYPENWYIKKG